MSLFDTIIGRQQLQSLPPEMQDQARSEARREFIINSLLGGRGLASGLQGARQVVPQMQQGLQQQRISQAIDRSMVPQDPANIGLTQIGPGSQAEILAQENAAFGLDPVAQQRTMEALQRNPNLPRQLDPGAYIQNMLPLVGGDTQQALSLMRAGAWGAPTTEIRNGRIVQVQRNDVGEERILEGASPLEAEQWGAPSAEVRNGQVVMVQRNPIGGERIVPGATPHEPTPTEVRTLQALNLPLTMENVMALKRSGASQQIVNMGDTQFGPLSQDRMRVPDPTAEGGYRIIDIPGGSADVEAQQRAQAEQFKQANLERAGGTVVQDVNRALDIIDQGGPLATGRGALIGRFDPVSQASQIEDLIGSVRGNIGVDQLQQMRNASPTGGALGNVTERMLEGLQGLLGSLKVTGSKEILQDNLKRISNIYMDTIHGTPEQIRTLGPQRGLTPEQIQILSERHELSFDERGQRIGGEQRQRPTQGPSLQEIFSPRR